MGVCDGEVTADVLFDCNNRPKKNLDKNKGVLINWDDIDRSVSTVDAEGVITALVLKAGKTGYSMEWYGDLASATGTFVPSTDQIPGYTHSFLSRLPNSSSENSKATKELAGGRFVMVYETKFKGDTQKDAFKVAGWGAGLKLSEATYNTAENSGTTLYTLATEEGDLEDAAYTVLYETSYAVTEASFISNFAAA